MLLKTLVNLQVVDLSSLRMQSRRLAQSVKIFSRIKFQLLQCFKVVSIPKASACTLVSATTAIDPLRILVLKLAMINNLSIAQSSTPVHEALEKTEIDKVLTEDTSLRIEC